MNSRGGPVLFATVAHFIVAALKPRRTEHHMTTDLLAVPWFAVPNDEIGGWAIATVDQPTSQIRPDGDEVVVFALFGEEQAARHIVALHNATLDGES